MVLAWFVVVVTAGEAVGHPISRTTSRPSRR